MKTPIEVPVFLAMKSMRQARDPIRSGQPRAKAPACGCQHGRCEKKHLNPRDCPDWKRRMAK